MAVISARFRALMPAMNRTIALYGNRWVVAILSLIVLILTPLGSLIVGIFGDAGDAWSHIVRTNLPLYLINSLLLVAGTLLLALMFGVPSAWFVALYDFPGRKWLNFLLVLPLALPAYIAGYAYVGLLDYDSAMQRFFSLFMDKPLLENLMGTGGCIFIFSSVLYPYVYLICRAAFGRQSAPILESAKLLGLSTTQIFWRIGLPMIRPAIVGAAALVFMETMNDYGLVKYFGVPTFTTGIFEAWYELDSATTAIRLSALLLIFTFVVLAIEYLQRGRTGFHPSQARTKPLQRARLTGTKAVAATVCCVIPVTLGFVLPATRLIYWAWLTRGSFMTGESIRLMTQSVSIALAAGILTTTVALLILFVSQRIPGKLLGWLARASTLGYAVPGAIIAVGIIYPFVNLQAEIHQWTKSLFGAGSGLFLSSTFAFLLFGYMVRFLAIAYHPLADGFARNCRRMDDAARLLGHKSWSSLRRIVIPSLRAPLISGLILIFVDVLKDLPLTLLLSPPDFSTLATTAYYLADNEAVAASGSVALMIMLSGFLPVYLIHRSEESRPPVNVVTEHHSA